MRGDAFLHLTAMDGESVDATHARAIDVLSWRFTALQAGTAHRGSAAGGQKTDLSDLMLTQYLDRATPVLLKACCSGKPFAEARLVVRRAGGSPNEFVKITLRDAFITECSFSTNVHDELITEHVSLTFNRLAFEYVPQKSDGSAGPSVSATWDILKNKES